MALCWLATDHFVQHRLHSNGVLLYYCQWQWHKKRLHSRELGRHFCNRNDVKLHIICVHLGPCLSFCLVACQTMHLFVMWFSRFTCRSQDPLAQMHSPLRMTAQWLAIRRADDDCQLLLLFFGKVFYCDSGEGLNLMIQNTIPICVVLTSGPDCPMQVQESRGQQATLPPLLAANNTTPVGAALQSVKNPYGPLELGAREWWQVAMISYMLR